MYVCQYCVARETGKHTPCYVLSIQIIGGHYIFSHALAQLVNIPQGKKVGKHIPLKSGGLRQSSMIRRTTASMITARVLRAIPKS